MEARVSADSQSLYIVDIGTIGFALAGAGPFPVPWPGTGVIWRITKLGSNPPGSPANLSAMPPKAFDK